VNLGAYLGDRRVLIEAALLARAESRWAEVPSSLRQAMRYSLFAGGKRLRPCLALASAEAFGGSPRGPVVEFACAVELVHTYSLIHDDLPCMDDDDLRRGRPTCHKAFGEALAILAGDALLTEAFHFTGLVEAPLAGQLTRELALGAGAAGMVGGQTLDLAATGASPLDAAGVEAIHLRKTAMLMGAAAAGGAVASGAPPDSVDRLRAYGRALGLAFQAADDWLDVEGSVELRGKRRGGDAAREKATLASALGVAGAKAWAAERVAEAEALAETLPAPGPLFELARFAMERRS
jgi:geranylgeranyl diphosphate synthase type II